MVGRTKEEDPWANLSEMEEEIEVIEILIYFFNEENRGKMYGKFNQNKRSGFLKVSTGYCILADEGQMP